MALIDFKGYFLGQKGPIWTFVIYLGQYLRKTLGGIETSNQGHLVFIGMCIILNVLLNSAAVMPRGLLFLIVQLP